MDDQAKLNLQCSEITKYEVDAQEFATKHPDYIIDGYHQAEQPVVKIVEYAPQLFKKIRNGRITEEQMMRSFIPNKNM